MKFTIISDSSRGDFHSSTYNNPIPFEEMYNVTAMPRFIATTNNRDSEPILKTEWQYILFYQERMIFEFSSSLDYNISEKQVLPDDQDLKYIIIETYNHLIGLFNEKRVEYSFFYNISTLEKETMNEFVEQLKRALSEV